MNVNLYKRINREYELQYGNIPNNQLDRIAYILGNKSNNEKYNQEILKIAARIKRIKWKEISFTLYKVVRPSARPRHTNRGGYIGTYVPHAKENGDWFEVYAYENGFPHIDTPCILDIIVYEKTPDSFSKPDKVLAEMGLINPWKITGDFDNYAKSIADFMQHGLLEDDYLVIKSSQELRYSIKPRCEIVLKYMEKFPDTKIKTKVKIKKKRG